MNLMEIFMNKQTGQKIVKLTNKAPIDEKKNNENFDEFLYVKRILIGVFFIPKFINFIFASYFRIRNDILTLFSMINFKQNSKFKLNNEIDCASAHTQTHIETHRKLSSIQITA